jgi:hypothetical protein
MLSVCTQQEVVQTYKFIHLFHFTLQSDMFRTHWFIFWPLNCYTIHIVTSILITYSTKPLQLNDFLGRGLQLSIISRTKMKWKGNLQKLNCCMVSCHITTNILTCHTLCTYIHTYIHVRLYIHKEATKIHTYTHIHTYIHTCMQICIHVHTYIHACMHACARARAHTHTHTYILTHTHTNTHIQTKVHKRIAYIHVCINSYMYP